MSTFAPKPKPKVSFSDKRSDNSEQKEEKMINYANVIEVNEGG